MSQIRSTAPAVPFNPTSLHLDGPVMVAVKPGGGGETTIAMATWLSRATSSPLQAVSVLEYEDVTGMSMDMPVFPQRPATERADVEARLKEQFRALEPERAPEQLSVLEGPAAPCITDLARDRGASAIVVGTGRHSVLGRFLYGERALQVVRSAVGPVLVVPPSAKPPFSHAVVAVDFSQASMRAAVTALGMLVQGGRLTLVHVKRALHLDEVDAGWWNDAYELRSRDMLERFAATIAVPAGLTLDTILLRGEVVDSLLAFGLDHEVDLIACGRLSHTLVARITVGSVSSSLVRRATCSVLVTPERPYDADIDDPSWMTGVLVSRNSEQWPQMLRGLNQRNTGRRAQLTMEAESPDGVESLQKGYLFLSAEYDRDSRHVNLLLGDADARGSHVTHRIARVRLVEMTADSRGKDRSVRFDTPTGRCILSFEDAA